MNDVKKNHQYDKIRNQQHHTTSNITKNEKKIYACNYLTIVIEEL